MSPKTTIYDIAKALNITAATVSRALNDNPKISEKTRKKVQQTAAKMGYQQNTLAQALKSGKSNNVGVIVPRVDTAFFGSIIRGIEEELYPKGYHVIICQTHDIASREIKNIDTLVNAQVDGIFMSISSPDIKEEHFERILKKNIPLIFFDRKKDIPNVSSVTINDFEGGYLSTKHLIEQGCKKILHLNGNQKIDIFAQRCKGYKKALKDYGITYDKDLTLETKSSIEEGKKVARKLIKDKELPDAIFSSSDFTALGVIQELTANGIKVPEDVCVTGFSNEPFTRFLEISMTTVDQSPIEMGKMAAKVFLEQADSKKVRIEKKVVLTPELIVRKSSTKK